MCVLVPMQIGLCVTLCVTVVCLGLHQQWYVVDCVMATPCTALTVGTVEWPVNREADKRWENPHWFSASKG